MTVDEGALKRLGIAAGLAFLLAMLWFFLSASPAGADGIVVPDLPPDQPNLTWRDVPLSIKYHRVAVTIENQVATTHVDQVFVNGSDFQVEGTYLFPLPEDAAISSFDMTVDGQRYEGQLLGRDEARAIYEGIVRQQRDPALLEYVGRGAFQARICPIPPGGERRIELTYSQVLQQDAGLVHYRYPLNTEKYSAKPIEQVAVTATIVDQAPIRTVYSPSHPIEVQHETPTRVLAGYEASDVRPDRDFDLYYSLSEDAITVNLLSYKQAGEDGYFLLLVTPLLEAAAAPVAKDVVLVLDTSGSMDGDKIEQARAAAALVLDQLGPDDRFNILNFGTCTSLFAEIPQPVTRRADGKAFVDNLLPEGSTNINGALLEALAGVDPERPTILIFVTDGLPTANETDPDRIVANVTAAAPKSVRLFAFGVGYDVDTLLLDELSSRMRGVSAYVEPHQALDEVIASFYAKVGAPVLVDVAMAVDGVPVEDLYPYPVPDLFAGTQLVVAGRYREGGKVSVTLSGDVNGQGQRITYDGLGFVPRGGNSTIARVWAQRKIGYLLAQIRLHGASEELVNEVVDLSRRFGIMTPYTSFLVLEPQAAQAPQPVLIAPPAQAPAGAATEAPAAAPAAAPAEAVQEVEKIVIVETQVVEQAVEALAAPDRSGQGAVTRAVTEQELASEAYAAETGVEGQVQQVGSKAFVRRGDAWIDTTYDAQTMPIERLSFGGDSYFRLLDERPEAGPYLALGQRVLVVLDGTAYAIGWTDEQGAGVAAPLAPDAQAQEQPAPQQSAPPVCPGAVGLALIGMVAGVRSFRKRGL